MGEFLLRPIHGALCMAWNRPDQQNPTHRLGRVTHLHRMETVCAENLLKGFFDRGGATPSRNRLCRCNTVHFGYFIGNNRWNRDEDSQALF